ncbi:TIGR04141 family sporadically distributed protein [Amycolatopsis sp. NBC_00345]|uniref:TIGR04141 family sporadically distributed protein n=1 Tax=Amycolatopsis sp. NBC_00345 TaxID=2975955 RepID=UPI002E26C667
MPLRTTCRQTTVYRLEGGRKLAQCLLSSTDGVEYDAPVEVGDVVGHLVVGTRRSERPTWSVHVESLTGYRLDMPGSQPYAVLLLPVGDWTYALTWGSGYQLIEDELIDQAFGLLFGIRRLNAERIGSVFSAALDASARSTLTSLPGGSDLGGFGIEPYGEVVTRVSGPAALDGLTYEVETHRFHQIRAGNSLSVPLPSSPGSLLRDLNALTTIVDEPDEHSALRVLAQVRRVDKSNRRLIDQLEGLLARALGGDQFAGPFGLAWPSAVTRDVEAAGSFRVEQFGRGGPVVFTPDDDLTVLANRFASIDQARRVKVLRNGRVFVCADDEGVEETGLVTPLRKWFAFEASVDGAKYCYHQGDWYRIGDGYLEQIRSQVADLLTHRADLTFPLWVPTSKRDDEHRYCELVAKQPGYVCLDRNLARTPFHPRFELCDVVGPGDELVHIKWLGRATAASHLYTQASTAAWSLREEPEALQQLNAKVSEIDGTRLRTEPSGIVLAIAGRAWDVDQLFTMSQIGLLRLERESRHLRTKLTFAEIPFMAKAEAKRLRTAA